MVDIQIRPAAPGEASLLTAVAHASKAHWGYPPELLAVWAPFLTISEELILRRLVWTAVLDGRVVGLYALGWNDDVPDLEHMWVHPESIGCGVGRALFEHAVGVARSAGAAELRIAADPHAEGFYLRMGALRVGDWESVPPGRWLPVLSLALTVGAKR